MITFQDLPSPADSRRASHAALGALVAAAIGSACLGQGQVVAWGENLGGSSSIPSGSLLQFRQVSIGGSHALAVRADGSIAAWGASGFGAATPPVLPGVIAVAAGADHSMALLGSGQVACWGYNGNGETSVPATLVDAIAIGAGRGFSVALRSTGAIACWGRNDLGQRNAPVGSFASISVGDAHSIALDAQGAAACWGFNPYGQCDAPQGTYRSAAAGYLHSVGLRTTGEVVCWGLNSTQQCSVPPNLGAVASVACAGSNSFALMQDGTVVQWGFNVATGEHPVPAGLASVVRLTSSGVSSAVIATRADGSLAGWGSAQSTELRFPSGGPAGVVAVDGGVFFSMALRADGTVTAWGDGNQTYVDRVPADLASVTAISGGDYHAMALRSDGTVRCWGKNDWGQGGVPQGLGPVTAIAAGGYHSLAVRADGTVVGWGAGTTNSGDPHFGQAIAPAGLSGVVEVSAGGFHSIARRADGSVVCWGSNVQYGTQPAGQSIVPPDLGAATAIAGGQFHSAAVTVDGRVRAWGYSGNGQTSVPPGLRGVVDVAAGAWHTAALLADGSVAVIGSGGAATVPAGLSGVTSIGAGTYHTLAALGPGESSCGGTLGAGSATLDGSGTPWNDVSAWRWTGTGPRVPGPQNAVSVLGYRSVGAACDARAGTLVVASGCSLLVPVDLGAPLSWQDHEVSVSGVATLSGRVWLLGSGANALPADLDVPVLGAASVDGGFDVVQTNVPPPPGKFLALVPVPTAAGTSFRLRLLDLPGTGSLSGGQAGAFGGNAVAAETMDWDGDGLDDLALAIDFGPSQPGRLQVLLNDGAGNLGSVSVQANTAPQPTCLATGDVNCDGRTDAVVGTASDSGVRVYLNNAPVQSPPFLPGAQAAPGGSPQSVVVLAGCGSLLPPGSNVGVGTTGGTSGGTVWILNGSTGATLQGVTVTVQPSSTTTVPTSGGRRIATTGTSTSTYGEDGLFVGEPGKLVILAESANGAWGVAQSVPVPARPRAIDSADIDGDGFAEIVTANADPVQSGAGTVLPVLTLFRGGASAFGNAVPIAPAGASSGIDVSLVDIEGDGDRDIVSVQRGLGTGSSAVAIRIDTAGPGGALSLGTETALAADAPILCDRGNLDGSGGEDIYLVDAAGGANLQGGAGASVRPFLGAAAAPSCPADLTGDGLVDGADLGALLVAWGGTGAADLSGNGLVDGADLAILLNDWGACPGQ